MIFIFLLLVWLCCCPWQPLKLFFFVTFFFFFFNFLLFSCRSRNIRFHTLVPSVLGAQICICLSTAASPFVHFLILNQLKLSKLQLFWGWRANPGSEHIFIFIKDAKVLNFICTKFVCVPCLLRTRQKKKSSKKRRAQGKALGNSICSCPLGGLIDGQRLGTVLTWIYMGKVFASWICQLIWGDKWRARFWNWKLSGQKVFANMWFLFS